MFPRGKKMKKKKKSVNTEIHTSVMYSSFIFCRYLKISMIQKCNNIVYIEKIFLSVVKTINSEILKM